VINRYTVIGQPIAHSLSPPIHALFGELTQRRIHYTRTEATPETFVETVRAWQASGGRGCNVTVPFKALALEACDRLSPAARRARSVNTIHMHPDGSRIGHTTDGAGLLADLEGNLRRPLAGRRVLLLGAGGAARAVVEPLLGARPRALHVANRTPARATALADAFAADGAVSGSGTAALAGLEPFDLVINATAASLAGELPPLPDELLAPDALAYDMMYGPADTVFTAWARARGHAVADGFGMLVEQAAEAFAIWESVRPKTRMAWARLEALRPPGADVDASPSSASADRRAAEGVPSAATGSTSDEELS